MDIQSKVACLFMRIFVSFNNEAITFFKELGQRTKSESGDPPLFPFLIQKAAAAIQWGNTAAVLGTLPASLFNCILLFCILL